MKYDALGLVWVQAQHFAQMPGYGFSLTVLIRCQPYVIRLFLYRLQLFYYLQFVFRYNILGFVAILHVYTHVFLFQVTDMPVARLHLKIGP